jgi:pimeloyl-ACP methyl ester carboxylesterase
MIIRQVKQVFRRKSRQKVRFFATAFRIAPIHRWTDRAQYFYLFYPVATTMLLKGTFALGQIHPMQPPTGPGGAEYAHGQVNFYDHAERADGYWLFEPTDPKPDSAEVVVFLHGYGAYNPMAYGKWIKHLVAKGNIVIYPRYQKNLIFPRPDGFPRNAAIAIRDAIRVLQTGNHVRPKLEKVTYIGHSYGGVTASHLGTRWEEFGIPKPAAMLLAEPGSGPFTGGRLKDYAALPSDMNLLVIAGEDDVVVGAEFSALVFKTAVNTPNRNLLIQRRDTTQAEWVLATHSEPYSYDLDFDTGVRNYTALRVLNVSRVNQVDIFCYWKLADALMDYTRHGKHGDIAFGNTPKQRFMGWHANGELVRTLDVILPSQLISDTKPTPTKVNATNLVGD